MSTDARRPRRRVQLALKRLLDIVLCLGVLVIAIPLLILIAILVKITSPGPLLFVQERVGRGKRTFPMYKIRTMRVNHHASDRWSNADAAAITPVGRFLRDYGFDELPQIFNILRGDMSIIGPRPPIPSQLARFDERLSAIFDMRPGVLSLAAAEGRRAISPERRLELHLQYVEQWSLLLDFRILWKCFFVVLKRENVDETAPELDANLKRSDTTN